MPLSPCAYISLAEGLNADGVPTKRDGRWTATTVQWILWRTEV